jgi:hypothetical protein
MNGFSQCVRGDRHPSVAEKIGEADMDDRARIVVGVDGSECARAVLDSTIARPPSKHVRPSTMQRPACQQ